MTEKHKVVVGMSGGIDSSAVAGLLVDQGHEVVGLTLHMFKEGSRCCSIEDVERARRVCDHLNIRHYVMNVVDEFHDSIIKPFVDEYAKGRTPSPCVWCNRYFKFGALLRRAEQIGCTHIATGHYVRIEHRGDGWHLLRPSDRKKDQSYFLHRLTQDQLARSLFPLEGMTKDQVRAYSSQRGLPAVSRGESQDLCFITDAGPAPLIEQYHPELKHRGAIVDTSGKKLGEHDGFHRFTIGQRGGLGIAAPTRLYVKELQPDANIVVVGRRDEIQNNHCIVEDVHWTSPAPLAEGDSYRHEGVSATIQKMDEKTIRLNFAQPQFAVTPGQAAVMYAGDEVMGGGWIAKENMKFEV